jgi:hypothetical protein
MRSGTGCYAGTDFYEKGRGTPLGHWIPVTHVGGNFYALGPAVWTVTAPSQANNHYTLIGNTLIWTVYLVSTSLDISLGTSAALYIALPGGYAGTGYETCAAELFLPTDGWVPGQVDVEPGNFRVAIQKYNKSTWVASGGTHVRFTLTMRIA